MASSASPLEPRIRQATARKWGRVSRNFSASHSFSAILIHHSRHIVPRSSVIFNDEHEGKGVTKFLPFDSPDFPERR